jgi:hypothetical protein
MEPPLLFVVAVSVGVVPAWLGVVPVLVSVGWRPWLPVMLPGDPLARVGWLLPAYGLPAEMDGLMLPVSGLPTPLLT